MGNEVNVLFVDASLWLIFIGIGLGLQKRGDAHAFISAGNTGAVMAASTLLLGLHPGVERPAIGMLFPTGGEPELVLDGGANVDCSPRELQGFAYIGAIYARDVLGRAAPTVGLLNIGEEVEKGSAAVKEANALLHHSTHFRFVGNVPNQKIGQYGAAGATPNGSLTVRVKYAYIDFNKLFANSKAFGEDKLTIGQETNPLIDWEEALYGYRYTSLVPWNYLSLSSTHAGVKLHGPVKMNGKTYLDYEVGAFDSGSFHNYELASEKQVMGRLSYYPMGATGRLNGFGLTGFADYGYMNVTPDSPNQSLYRVAALVHYTNNTFGLAGEYDYGKNAFGVGNLFSGSGPVDAFGLGTTQFAGLAAEAKSILVPTAQQQGFDFFGHVNIPHSPFSIFGLFQYFQPNTNVSKDPLDFERIVAGIAYKYNGHLRFALDSQNLIYTQSQFTFNGIPNAVPTNSNALFANFELNY